MAPNTRARFNFLLEGIALLLFILMITTGLLLEFRLPHGGGRGGWAWLGITRHEWGDIHFYLAIGFIVTMLVHLWMHWRWIWGLACGSVRPKQQRRGIIFLTATVAMLLLLSLPWLLPVDERNEARGRGRMAHLDWKE